MKRKEEEKKRKRKPKRMNKMISTLRSSKERYVLASSSSWAAY